MPSVNPALTESTRTRVSPSGSASITADVNNIALALPGGILLLNVPVAVSIAGYAAPGSSATPSSPKTPWINAVLVAFAPSARGVTDFVMRADSSELGPDLSEFTSDAVTPEKYVKEFRTLR